MRCHNRHPIVTACMNPAHKSVGYFSDPVRVGAKTAGTGKNAFACVAGVDEVQVRS